MWIVDQVELNFEIDFWGLQSDRRQACSFDIVRRLISVAQLNTQYKMAEKMRR